MRSTTLPRAIALLLPLLVVLPSLTSAPARAQVSDEDPRVEEIQRIIEAIRASGPPATTGAVLAEPEGEAPDPQAPAVALRTAMAQLEGVRSPGRGGRVPPPLAAGIRRAADDLGQAYGEFVGDEPELSVVMDRIAATVRALDGARPRGGPFQRQLRPVKEGLTATSRHLAVGILQRGIAGGVSEARVAEARRSLQLGDQLVLQSQFVQAIGQFGNVLTLGETLVFDVDLFEENIRSALDDQTVGYAYSIGVDGLLATQGAAGLARTSTDAPELDQSALKEMNIASVSKTITGVAILKLLQEQGVGIDSSVAPFLPAEWDVDPSIDDLTFEDLLTQRSGLNGNVATGFNGQLFDALQASVEQGVDPADKTYFYQNQNFSLLRVVLPYLWEVNPITFGQPLEVVTAAIYVYYVQTEIFAPMGIEGDCKPVAANPTLSYTFPFDGMEQGFDNDGDWTLACGAGGWHLSANELAAFLAHLRFNDTILSPATRALMDERFLAWLDPANDGFSWGNGAFGVYHNHGGDYFPPGGSNGPGLRSCFMDFHIAVQASVLINSRGGSHPQQCQLLTDAFDSAWVEGS